MGSPGGSVSKESACNAGDSGINPGWGRPPGEGNGNPLQYSCLGNPMDRGTWQSTVHWVTKSWTWLKLLGSLWKCGEKIPGEPTCFRQEGKKKQFWNTQGSLNKIKLTWGKWKWKSLSRVLLFVTSWTAAHQAPVHWISQARILEWVAISFSRGSSPPRDQTHVSCIAGRFFTTWATKEAQKVLKGGIQTDTHQCS